MYINGKKILSVMKTKIINVDEDTVAFAEAERQKSKNLLVYPYADTTKTDTGITFNDNGDGSITINGTNSGGANSNFYLTKTSNHILPAGTYTLGHFASEDNGAKVVLYDKTYYHQASANSSVTFTLSEETECYIYVGINKGTTFTFNNVVVKPMLVSGTELGEYQPYNGAIVHEKDIADVEHYETIYDMSDSKYNYIGETKYEGGLMFSSSPSYPIMSETKKNKYKYFRVTAHLVNTDIIFEFKNNTGGYARGGFACQASWLDDTSFCFGHISIATWGTINGTNCRTQKASTITDRRDNSNYYISKIEGVY